MPSTPAQWRALKARKKALERAARLGGTVEDVGKGTGLTAKDLKSRVDAVVKRKKLGLDWRKDTSLFKQAKPAPTISEKDKQRIERQGRG